jgi:hypothetical protein
MEPIISGAAADKVMDVGKCKETTIIDHSALCEKLTKLGKFADDVRERVEQEKLRRNSHISD